MLVLVVSDTHGRHEDLQTAIQRVKPDVMLHLGDSEGFGDYIQRMAGCPLYIVRGNCDFSPVLEDDLVVELGKHKVFMTHGHRYDVKYHNQHLVEAAKAHGCDIALYGHTHCPELVTEDGVMVMNPGSISLPRQEGRRASYAVMTVDETGEVTANIVYL